MTDLLRVLPHFPISQYASLMPGLERHQVSVSDLLTLDAADLGKRTHLPLLDLQRLSRAVLDALHTDLGVADELPPPSQAATTAAATTTTTTTTTTTSSSSSSSSRLRHTPAELSAGWSVISTLDDALDRALGGGIPAGYVTEITGESGAGKTQLLLSLLLAVQLPPPRGLGRPALYVTTEAPLSTRRLAQMLASNPVLRSATAGSGASGASRATAPSPSLDGIVSATTPDLESQDHILTFQVPVEVARRNVGLVVLDSVAANYRAEFDRGPAAMGARSADLARLGMHLRELARKHHLAVVVANQVADRFNAPSPLPLRSFPGPATYSSPATATAAATTTTTPYNTNKPPSRTTATTTTTAGRPPPPPPTQESPLATRSRAPTAPLPAPDPISSSIADVLHPPPPPPSFPVSTQMQQQQQLLLDHQQRWFTGWGDEPEAAIAGGGGGGTADKTPSLGLVWSTQVAARVALIKRPTYGRARRLRYEEGGGGGGGGGEEDEDGDDGRAALTTTRSWRRWMKVVFAPHVAPSGPGIDDATEFEVTMGGLRAVKPLTTGG